MNPLNLPTPFLVSVGIVVIGFFMLCALCVIAACARTLRLLDDYSDLLKAKTDAERDKCIIPRKKNDNHSSN